MTTLWATIVVIGVLVFIHELGHYLAARSVGVRVDRFSIGFPPRLLSFISRDGGWQFQFFFYRRQAGRWVWAPVYETFFNRPGRTGTGTEYCMALLPLGGYVKMAGMIDESLDDNISHAPDELESKSSLAQVWVMSAGVIMNMVLAFVLFSGVALHTGRPEASDEAVIASVIPDMPADAAGFQEGDRILRINTTEIETWTDMSGLIHTLPNTNVHIVIDRDGQKIEQDITTSFQVVPAEGKLDTLGAIGIYPEFTYHPIGLGESLAAGVRSTMGSFGMIFMSINMLVTGDASIKELGGPIMIAQMAGETARAGWAPLLSFMALISVNLAFLNILPIPGLDGGHILVTMIQAIIRRKLSIRIRMIIQQIGMALLLVLMITVIFNDIGRLFGG